MSALMNLPVLERPSRGNRVSTARAGGVFDIYWGTPVAERVLYMELLPTGLRYDEVVRFTDGCFRPSDLHGWYSIPVQEQ